jgi:hypothetical protein
LEAEWKTTIFQKKLREVCKIDILVLNNVGLRTQPCFNPFPVWNEWDTSFDNLTLTDVEAYMFWRISRVFP